MFVFSPTPYPHPPALHSFPTRRSSDLEPSSELHVAELWYRSTALEDLLGVSTEDIYDERLYRALDRLLPHKETIEKRSEEHTSELQSRFDLVCRLLLEKKKRQISR